MYRRFCNQWTLQNTLQNYQPNRNKTSLCVSEIYQVVFDLSLFLFFLFSFLVFLEIKISFLFLSISKKWWTQVQVQEIGLLSQQLNGKSLSIKL